MKEKTSRIERELKQTHSDPPYCIFCTTIISFVWIWYRSEFFKIYFHCSNRFVCVFFSLLFSTVELYSKAVIIYARSFLSSLRLDKRHFFSAGASHYVCINIFIARYIQNKINWNRERKKKSHKKRSKFIYSGNVFAYLLFTEAQKSQLVHCFSIFSEIWISL